MTALPSQDFVLKWVQVLATSYGNHDMWFDNFSQQFILHLELPQRMDEYLFYEALAPREMTQDELNHGALIKRRLTQTWRYLIAIAQLVRLPPQVVARSAPSRAPSSPLRHQAMPPVGPPGPSAL